ncbi:hypothetical protein HT747_16790 [Brevibacillus borstelensis]|uniref:DUF6240 domain-containing protein n=1 Tax=Brevibacillus borstelensis TaxID=45462 RepID=UPI001561E638|nr:DUF6240 domain-containing protein [Brevibacillus borstelensis]MBE5396796.1 hypothetical protein [Brevibacillus borstelensis]
MRINQSTSGTQLIQNDQPLEIKEGEVYSVKVKERISDKEAIVQIRGKDVHVQFEGKVPSGERATIQVTNGQGQFPQVKTVLVAAGNTASEPDVQTVLTSMGEKATQELKQAAKILLDNGIPLSKESLRDVKEFFERASGTVQQKLDTIQMIANKKLSVTSTHLRSVHEALHGPPLTNVLTDFGNKPTTNKTAKIILQTETNLDKAIQHIRDHIVNNPRVTPEVTTKVEKAVVEAIKLQHAGQETAARQLLLQTLSQFNKSIGKSDIPTQSQNQMSTPGVSLLNEGNVNFIQSDLNHHQDALLNKLINLVQQEPSMEQALRLFTEQFGDQAKGNPDAASKVEKALAQAVTLQQIGWEQVGREQVLKVLDQVGPDLFADLRVGLDKDPLLLGQYDYDRVSDLQAGAFLGTRDLVVTEITKKLSQAASDFQTVKREMARNISNVIQVIETNNSNVFSGVKPLLESTIDMLDKSILKSEITMLTDMETEKQLMKASSQLAEARSLLTKGENGKAIDVLQGVKAMLESLQWKPSNVRIQHFLTRSSIFSEEAPSTHQLANQVVDITNHFQNHPPSPRNTFEFFRSLGLNYESEVAQALSSGQPGSNQDLHKNLKVALMQLAKSEDGAFSPLNNHHSAEQALHNLNGQQLLSKSEAGSNLQSMFFQLPAMLGDRLESVKLYVNSKNKGQKIDWENCSLYFLLETKKMGPTGILISTVDRNLSITIKNDQQGMKERLEPVVMKCKENLQGIGYNIAGVTFTRLTEEKAGHQQLQAQNPARVNRLTASLNSLKGFDFKI